MQLTAFPFYLFLDSNLSYNDALCPDTVFIGKGEVGIYEYSLDIDKEDSPAR